MRRHHSRRRHSRKHHAAKGRVSFRRADGTLVSFRGRSTHHSYSR